MSREEIIADLSAKLTDWVMDAGNHVALSYAMNKGIELCIDRRKETTNALGVPYEEPLQPEADPVEKTTYHATNFVRLFYQQLTNTFLSNSAQELQDENVTITPHNATKIFWKLYSLKKGRFAAEGHLNSFFGVGRASVETFIIDQVVKAYLRSIMKMHSKPDDKSDFELVDSPEDIKACLNSKQLNAQAEQFLRAQPLSESGTARDIFTAMLGAKAMYEHGTCFRPGKQ